MRVPRREAILCLVSAAIALVGAELFVRAWVPRHPPVRFEQDLTELRAIRLPQLAGVIEADPDLFWRFKPAQRLPRRAWPFFGIISNAQGLREDHEIPPGSHPHEIRILFLGDSCTFGYGVDLRQTFVEIAEDRLGEANPGVRFECINAGVPGYSAYQGLRLLEREGPRLRPDLVVAAFGWNDMTAWDGQSDLEHAVELARITPPRPLVWSRLARLAWRLRALPAPGGRAARPRLNGDEFHEVLGRMDAASRRLGSDFVLLVWAYRQNVERGVSPERRTPLQREMVAYGEAHGVPVVDLVPRLQALARERPVDDLFFDIGHATPAAHEVIAGVLLRTLGPWARRRVAERTVYL